jgi:hypothetical protein
MLGAIPLINRWLADMAPRLPALAPHAVAWRDLAVVTRLLFHTPDVASRVAEIQAAVDRWHAGFVQGPQRVSCEGAIRQPGVGRPSRGSQACEHISRRHRRATYLTGACCGLLPGGPKRLYGRDSLKPKIHHLLHVPECVQQVGWAANCFTAERRHSWLRSQAEQRFRGYERAVIVKMVGSSIEQWRTAGQGPPPQLHAPAPSPEAAAIWAAVFGPCEALASTAARLVCGETRRGDLLARASSEVGWAAGFWEVRHAAGVDLFAAVEPLRQLSDDTWAGEPGGEELWRLQEASLLARPEN